MKVRLEDSDEYYIFGKKIFFFNTIMVFLLLFFSIMAFSYSINPPTQDISPVYYFEGSYIDSEGKGITHPIDSPHTEYLYCIATSKNYEDCI